MSKSVPFQLIDFAELFFLVKKINVFVVFDVGRKRGGMMMKMMGMFVMPFLIQSAIMPLLVTKMKLLLVKSLLVGKLAIFLLVMSAMRNSKQMQGYDMNPSSYWGSDPNRKYEVIATNNAYGGYRAEGKPVTWIN